MTTTLFDQPLDTAFDQPPDSRTLVAAAAGGLAFDLAVRSGVVGVGSALAVAVGALAVTQTGRRRADTGQARALAAAAVVFGACLALRTSPWLLLPDTAAAAGLLALAASLGPHTRLRDLSIPAALARAASTAAHMLGAPGFVLRAWPRRHATQDHVWARAVLLASPVVAVLAVLLRSADPVFGAVFRLPNSGDVALHGLLIGIGGLGIGGLVRAASAPPPALGPGRWALGPIEARTLLGSLTALFGAFAATQAVTALGGARHVLQTRHLTYAQYARSGFFQLLAVSVITLAVLLAVRSATAQDRVARTLARAAIALTLVIVAVSLRRFALYEDAYGLTMLRLACQLAAVWIGGVFVLLAAALAKRWVPAAAAAGALALLLALNVANPERIVVEANVGRNQVDQSYLAGLSDDAVPALVRAGIVGPCERSRSKGWAAANWSRQQAIKARKRAHVCQP
jgi:uncharacterized membrane protein